MFRSLSSPPRIVYLELSREEAKARLDRRKGHHAFVKDFDRLLSGQFRNLEVPENAVVVPATLSPDEQVEHIAAALALD